MASFFTGVSAGTFFWIAAALSALTVAAFAGTFVFLYRKRLMEDTPTARIGSAHQGYVEFEGWARLMPGTPIVSPLTKSHCLWWRFRVERHQRGSGKRTTWSVVHSGASDDAFLLEDDSGSCVVDPYGAKVIPKIRRRWYGETPMPGIGPAAGGGMLRAMYYEYRYTEELILPGNPLYVLGTFRTQMDAGDPMNERADLAELLTRWKHDKKMMALLDTNKDGSLNAKEWEAARRMALRQVRAEHVERAVETPALNLLSKGADRRPFLLSAITQERLVLRFQLQAMGSLLASGLCGGFLLWALQLRGLL